MADERKAESTPLAPGEVVTCTVEQIMPYGAFVRMKTGQRAMIHISELSHSFVKKVEDVLSLSQEVQAKVIKIDEKGRIDLSLKKMEAPRPASASRGSSSFGPAAPEDTRDSFEKKLSNYLKASESKIADLNNKLNNSRAAKKRGKPAK
ncbi:S1 RNA binding domain protein [Aminivibrio pyruvatiphilus]|jgi:S1 RNA binding domain protein|uniref:S1 RNA binding domain protein n=1 Tax=Aminivibrio pyruvatiphilus TaxID=1005740 RepID=A0A4R8MKY7_9BACT|nr:S1 RNA-binding domain-containing protein [Aminivibrio pyruvatiphilus]TDY65082.1 S1 RNA binding domain protein [Aminivibrio pyruvatiphilus]